MWSLHKRIFTACCIKHAVAPLFDTLPSSEASSAGCGPLEPHSLFIFHHAASPASNVTPPRARTHTPKKCTKTHTSIGPSANIPSSTCHEADNCSPDPMP
ncbi:hypothetical protein LshimejAT787_0207300 [Lyophyllum shimeji]|uniref:Uncharacterized protein n=1 Tax=Lyophyllum shimeji TaxID=47721 RepID=A0A9P3PFQ5_LYOSH|nr:hypothetical protein LshimejAT787_0207300 [Lyophyllum shimeji]